MLVGEAVDGPPMSLASPGEHWLFTFTPWDRLHLISGTKGMARKYPKQAIALEPSAHQFLKTEEFDALMAEYEHPLATQIGEKAKMVGGHGGMDFIMDCRLVYCLQNGLPLDMDVYDLAEWCCLAELGTLSMDNNCAAVAFPDFTRGEWNVVKGYKHAYASPEEEKAVAEKAAAFTAKLKEQGEKEWGETENQEAK